METNLGKEYSMFREYLDEGRVQEACKLLRENPHVMHMLSPYEIVSSYLKIRRKDSEEADYFKKLIA